MDQVKLSAWVDAEVRRRFRLACLADGVQQQDILARLMARFADEKLAIALAKEVNNDDAS